MVKLSTEHKDYLGTLKEQEGPGRSRCHAKEKAEEAFFPTNPHYSPLKALSTQAFVPPSQLLPLGHRGIIIEDLFIHYSPLGL